MPQGGWRVPAVGIFSYPGEIVSHLAGGFLYPVPDIEIPQHVVTPVPGYFYAGVPPQHLNHILKG